MIMTAPDKQLMLDLGIEVKDSQDLEAYLHRCGGFDYLDFEFYSEKNTEQVKMAKQAAEEFSLTVDPNRIVVVQELARVWLYLTESFYALKSAEGVLTDPSLLTDGGELTPYEQWCVENGMEDDDDDTQ